MLFSCEFDTNLQYLKFETNLQSFCALGKLTKTVNIQGEKFVMDSKGKTLQRIGKGTCIVNNKDGKF